MIERTDHGDVSANCLSWWRSRVANLQVHVYVVRGVLVDTGFPAAQKAVAAIANDHGVRGAMITHQHEDHAGNVEWLARAGIPLAMSDDTRTRVQAAHRIGLYRHFTWQAMTVLRTKYESFSDDDLSLVPAPGHSADHHVVWDNATGTVFLGDLFLGVKVRIAHSYEDPLQQVSSIRAILARSPSRAFCSHRGVVSLHSLAAKADWIEETVYQIRTLAESGQSVSLIRQQLFGPRGTTHWISAGDYSPDNFVRAALRPTAVPWRYEPPVPHGR